MANPRRSSYSNSSNNNNNQSSEHPIQIQLQQQQQQHSQNQSLLYLSSLLHFLKKPHAFPFLLSIFLLLTWLSLRIQRSPDFSAHSSPPQRTRHQWTHVDDSRANLRRFTSGFPSPVAKDQRGWLVNPISLALDSGLLGGAVSCASVHVGEIRPGGLRGNHRHYSCNETFVLWGAQTKFRLENRQADKGYAEVMIGADEVAVAVSPSGTAHAIINMDPIRTAFLLGCQDSIINYNSSATDFNVWKDL
ncbi:RmlC-type cupin [Trema orientale]|uniref:RmlC-type cupin n=1 Tax=Trema orientale TaxID=63057 RepID=A0A2P5EW65_TREOI|nr:RmlC-type cupin [Trema orientale]